MMRRALVSFVFFVSASVWAVGVGEKAPDFSLSNQEGKTVRLSDFAGKPVLIFFYPKDETPGCTKEACVLRDKFRELQKKGAVVLGVSTQGAESHKKFREKHKLPFDLLVDADGSMAAKYGVGKMPGTDLLERKSVLIGPDGKVAKRYETVDPGNHAKEVLEDLSALSGRRTG